MAKTTSKNLADNIVQLNINGLKGRMLRLPPPPKKNREILFVYGHHASLERFFGMAEALNNYGAVTMPDLPGFGGMQSFYKIGLEPNMDNLADYLATFIKLRYKRRRITIVGMSFGFTVVTKMLQKYPEIAGRVDMVVSSVGFVHHQDFHLKRRFYYTFKYLPLVFTLRSTSWFVQNILYQPVFIRFIYGLVENKNEKLKGADKEEVKKRIDFEVHLWRCNDVRTYMRTTREMFTLNLCDKQVGLPVYHVYVDTDRYFDNRLVEQHMRVIYKDYIPMRSNMTGHSQTVTETAEEVMPFFPLKLRRLLSKA